MSVFASQIRYRPWLGQVTLLSTVMGGLLALSLKTQDRIRSEQMPNMRNHQIAAAYVDMRDTVSEQNRVIADLRKRVQKYQENVDSDSPSARLLKEDMKKANLLAGLVAVTGTGVIVTLQDSKKMPPRPTDVSPDAWVEMSRQYIIHDSDIQSVINELRAAGAEAIAVNDQRVVGSTSIRCVGPVVLVNNVQTNASPVRIKAIGDSDTLSSSLSMPNGTQDQFKMVDPSMFTIDKSDSITLPAFTGAMPLRYARPAPENKADQAQRQAEAAAEASKDALSGNGSGGRR